MWFDESSEKMSHTHNTVCATTTEIAQFCLVFSSLFCQTIGTDCKTRVCARMCEYVCGTLHIIVIKTTTPTMQPYVRRKYIFNFRAICSWEIWMKSTEWRRPPTTLFCSVFGYILMCIERQWPLDETVACEIRVSRRTGMLQDLPLCNRNWYGSNESRN